MDENAGLIFYPDNDGDGFGENAAVEANYLTTTLASGQIVTMKMPRFIRAQSRSAMTKTTIVMVRSMTIFS